MKYPFIKCLNPRVVVNKYTGDKIEVGCGVCKACLMERAQRMTLQCSLEEQDHKYCRFVTLTYTDENIPKMRPVYDKEHGITRYISECDRLGDEGKVMAVDYDCYHKEPLFNAKYKGYNSLLLDKCRLNGCMSYVSVREAQLFIKRVRKHLKKYSDEKIRYYVASEYGPKTFRAHYHVLFYYDTEETAKAMPQVIRSSWPYGRIDQSISRGKVASYVARYVNSNHFIPPVLGSMSSKPFSLHSTHFAKGFYQSKKAEIYEDDVERFIRVGRVIAGDYVEFMPWRSLTATFFPKCRGFNVKSYDQLFRSYTILRQIKATFGTSFQRLSFPQIADNIVDMMMTYLEDESHDHKMFRRFYCRVSNAPLIVAEYFCDQFDRHRLVAAMYNLDESKSLSNAICSDMYVSKHFLDFVCDNDEGKVIPRLHQIIKYWKRRDMANLNQMYLDQEEYKQEFPNGLIDWFYYNRKQGTDGIMKEAIYKNFVVDTYNRFDRSLKHKRHNDVNNFFIYG